MSRVLRWVGLLLIVSGAAQANRSFDDVLEGPPPTPQRLYAERRLSETMSTVPSARGWTFELALDAVLGPEAFRIESKKRVVHVTGGDPRGLIYGVLRAREQLLNGVPPSRLAILTQTPKLAFRGIKLNTPWDSYRPSSAIDQHTETMKDLKFWEAYLDMMVENRFNSFTLWTMHPFTYMVRPKNFPEASKWTDEEFAQWQRLYRSIFRMAKERGLDTYVVFWSIFVSEEFEKARTTTSTATPPRSPSAICARASRRCWWSTRTWTASACPTAKAWVG
jgi:hypothetical protein